MIRCRPASAGRSLATSGFTMLEVMAVVLILGTVLLLVPMNMDGWGARSRLDMGANSVVAALRAAREQAIQDGYDCYLQLGWTKIDDEDIPAYRFRFTNVPTEKATAEQDSQATERQRSTERAWQLTDWAPLPRGIVWAGISERKAAWRGITPGGQTREVHFDAGGNADQALAIRIKSEDLEVDEESKTITIVLNALTAEPSWVQGRHELREALDASHFNY